MIEIWRPVVGWEDSYEISSLGRVKSIRARRGVVVGRILKPALMSVGYLFVTLADNYSNKQRSIHDMVAAAFIGERPSGHVINHKDNNKFNNSPENLEYVTQNENVQHARRLGLIPRGEKVKISKLLPDQVLAIRSLANSGISQVKIGEKFGVSQSQVSKIILRQDWDHLPPVAA